MGHLEMKAADYAECIPAAPDAGARANTGSENFLPGAPPCGNRTGAGRDEVGLLLESPLPGDVPAEGIEVCQAVIADIQARQQLGMDRYGKPLRLGEQDGRNWLREAYEEALDKTIYLRTGLGQLEQLQQENERLKQENSVLRTLNASMACRIGAQADLLSKKAEKKQEPWFQQSPTAQFKQDWKDWLAREQR